MAEGTTDALAGLLQAPQASTATAPSGGAAGKPSDSSFSFSDVLHALNPLQYIPVVGTIYRAVTGDTISPTLRIAGSFVSGLLSGGIGAVASIAGAALEEVFHLATHNADGDTAKKAAAADSSSSPKPEAGEPKPAATPAAATAPPPPPAIPSVALRGGQTVALAAPSATSTAAAVAAYRNVSALGYG